MSVAESKSYHAAVMFDSDLRPANILLGDRGHILLTYFSQWNTVECRINDQAFDSLYCAPGLCHMLTCDFIIYIVSRICKSSRNVDVKPKTVCNICFRLGFNSLYIVFLSVCPAFSTLHCVN